MIETIIILLAGFLISIISLIVGFNMGKNNDAISPEIKKRLNQTLQRAIPPNDVGGVLRPTSRELELARNEKERLEQDIMSDTFKEVINK